MDYLEYKAYLKKEREALMHSAKGTSWEKKNHLYIRKYRFKSLNEVII